ncbi:MULTISPECIES: DUF1127 domain-containing protein [Pseudomonas]|jgi:uncharacterized protein YjiS (DUF1127 family)|uniref:YjiS-like domain-containing protein n=2 Tax=Ectopseudomonas TaxID=3236654 RepID=A0A653BC37_ECTOL|nr:MULTISPECIES: DUF1127 domain-containing protein [Pseudomonas]CAE6927267.1 conserved protein of unknown function [Pseudomonas oleovorans]QFT22341.1 hypothetical protein FIV02_12235 [Pseudomonas sp. THAF187a]QFT42528.1 hypothetical protein FIU98_12215 [Pseudomonas sp. THAF42]QTS84390.1 DUF1127 domain-containing protein [Pseudomonas khazarica]HIQ44843.1 DUF1127 domain-containing protein [Pseudomonas oleovorans]
MKGQKGYALAQAIHFDRLPSLAEMWRVLRRWRQLARERQQLARLDGAALKDLGLSRADALQEAERPFWDDPLRK